MNGQNKRGKNLYKQRIPKASKKLELFKTNIE